MAATPAAAKTGPAANGLSATVTSSPQDSTFITGLRHKGSSNAAATPEAYEVPGMERVHAIHGQLQHVVGTLNEKVAAVLQKQEREFLRAYRAHMYQLQRELQALRAKADDAAIQLAKNEKIRSLEAERDWYRSEALRLDQFCTALKSDVTFMRDKLAAIEEDRLWLESKLKNGLKAGGNRFLASQLQAASASTSMLSGSASSARLSSTTGSTGSAKIGLAPGTAPSGAGRGARTKLTVPGMTVAPLTRPAKPAAATAASPADAAPSLAILQSEDYGADTLVSESGSLEAATPATAPAHASRLASMQSGAPSDIQTKIAALERRVEKLTAKNTQLKASNAALKSARSELDDFFRSCVEEVRKDVRRRKVSAANQAAPRGLDAGGSMASSVHYQPSRSLGAVEEAGDASFGSAGGLSATEQQRLDAAVAVARAQHAGLESFTAADKRQVVERMLAHDGVLARLEALVLQG